MVLAVCYLYIMRPYNSTGLKIDKACLLYSYTLVVTLQLSITEFSPKLMLLFIGNHYCQRY